jgi:hypothetical protein
MKKMTGIFLFVLAFPYAPISQEITTEAEQQLETIAAANESETEDDSYLQQLDYLKRHPINLNTADEVDLKELLIISESQVRHLLAYRKLLGLLLNIYELQAIPSWDLVTIKKILPFVFVGPAISAKEDMATRLKKGEHSLLFRVSQVLEKAKGFDHTTPGAKYLGSRQRLYYRYRYNYKNLLQFGILGEKDAGEAFFSGAQKWGFDFYSAFLFVRQLGKIHALALGDFTVNMGQGLIQWQSLAFKKSAEIVSAKRQSPVLRPYNSAGEFNFFRGMGITLRRQNWETTVFGSMRKLNANKDIDTNNHEVISSFLSSGNNRTANEILDKNSLSQTVYGANIHWRNSALKIGLNTVVYSFSLPILKRDEPYNLFSWKGNNWYNASVDYNYTFRNFHFFGEVAIDRIFNKAILNGVLLSADAKVDLSIVHRQISPAYQAVNANAFTENSAPSNEHGIFVGLTLRPMQGWKLDFYSDIYTFPWLKYLVDAPSYGRDWMCQLTYTPNRQVELSSRFRNEISVKNLSAQPDLDIITNYPAMVSKINWRWQLNNTLTRALSIRNRVEAVWYRRPPDSTEAGFLAFFDVIYKPMRKPYAAVGRLQYFETEGYNSRLYAYENDVLYGSSIPALFDNGFRYYLTFSYELKRTLTIWVRWAQTIYRNKYSIGTASEEIAGNRKSELKFQLRYFF